MPVRLIDSLATTAPLAELFSDGSVARAMLEFEAALARAEALHGVIPADAAKAIVAAIREGFDETSMADWPAAALRNGTPAIPLIAALTARVRARDPEAAGFVHRGATSQDVCDTAMVLLLQKAQPVLESDLNRLRESLRQLTESHATTVMPGRTLLQPAPPITFGLKAANWLAAVQRSHDRLNIAFRENRVLQLGGAGGTLAALDDRGVKVGEAMARDLGLDYPDSPWHTQRDRPATLLCACGVLTGVLGKIARDVSLLMQAEIAEVSETSAPGRGGSSSMPHKHNPVGCIVTLAAAGRVPGMVSSFLAGMAQEHERAAGGWQAEWSIIAGVIQGLGLAAASMAEVMTGLIVNEDRMRANLEATQGVIFAEKALVFLAEKMERDNARALVEEALRRCARQGLHLREALAAMPEVAEHFDAAALRHLEDPALYLGAADEFRKRILAAERVQDKQENKRKE